MWFIIYLLGIPCTALFVCGTFEASGITPEKAGDKEFAQVCLSAFLWPIVIPMSLCFYLGYYLERKTRNDLPS